MYKKHEICAPKYEKMKGIFVTKLPYKHTSSIALLKQQEFTGTTVHELLYWKHPRIKLLSTTLLTMPKYKAKCR